MRRWKRRPEGSNWGDFGDDDQIGRMNLLTPERRLKGLRAASEGIAFTLSLPLDYPGGSVLSANRKPPQLIAPPRAAANGASYPFALAELAPEYTDVVCDDAVLLYTQYSTQWDSLAHAGGVFDADDDGVEEIVFYNGYRAGEHILAATADGSPRAAALGIETLAVAGVQGRGVMVDLFAIHGRDKVRVGYDGLMRALERGKESVETGDFLCLYTGFGDVVLEGRKAPDPKIMRHSCAGLDGADKRLLQWIADSGIVAICADNFAVEHLAASPNLGHRHAMMPLHELCLFKLGIYLGELWYFTELANWLAAHHRSSFLLTAPPLRLPGSVGSPLTPIGTV